jgi:hypothetical protein
MSTLSPSALLASAGVTIQLQALAYPVAPDDSGLLLPTVLAQAPVATSQLGPWRIDVHPAELDAGLDLMITATATTALASHGLGLTLNFSTWSDQHHLHLPGAVYAGNRRHCHPQPYSPRMPPELASPAGAPVITDIPRLALQGAGRIDLLTGDQALPAAAVVDPAGTAVILLTEQGSAWGDHGFNLEEDAEHRHLRLRLAAPGVRAQRYRFMSTGLPSPDRGGCFALGDRLELRVRLWVKPSTGIHGLFDHLLSHRHDLAPAPVWQPSLPLSAASDLIAAHYQRDCWLPEPGLYATECKPGSIYRYQTGWCGGLINTRAFVIAQDPAVRARAMITIGNALRHGQTPCGLLWGKWTEALGYTSDYGHDDARGWTKAWTLVRRQGDALYFLLRTFAALEAADPIWRLPAEWATAVRRLAEAFCGTWERHGQFGQFLNQRTAEVEVGGTTSGAIVPAGLILAWRRFGDSRFRTVAEAAATSFIAHLATGVTAGGPGDAVQAPDSESVAGLVEAFATLFNATGDRRWLAPLSQAAAQAATWVMPYDYRFPPNSEFGRLGMSSLGTVFANAQNKHSAPGICTHSGLGLFVLHRATGDLRPLRLLAEIARSLPQFVSRDDRPITALDGQQLPSGWINERVNTSDWDDNLGGVFYGMTWAEISLLLTACELPSIYVRRDLGQVTVFDQVTADLTDGILTVLNPTRFPARITILSEDAGQAAEPLGDAGIAQLPVVAIEPGAVYRISV